MIRTAAALALAAFPALADPVTLSDTSAAGDSATLRMESAILGVLTYHNTGLQQSQRGEWEITSGELTCTIAIEVGDDETATVTCPPGWIVDPPIASVADGDTFAFIVTMAGF